MSELSDVSQSMPALFLSQAEAQNQALVQGTVAASQSMAQAKAAEEQVELAEETQNPRVRAEEGRRERPRLVQRHPRRRRRRPQQITERPPSPDGHGSVLDVTA